MVPELTGIIWLLCFLPGPAFSFSRSGRPVAFSAVSPLPCPLKAEDGRCALDELQGSV